MNVLQVQKSRLDISVLNLCTPDRNCNHLFHRTKYHITIESTMIISKISLQNNKTKLPSVFYFFSSKFTEHLRNMHKAVL